MSSTQTIDPQALKTAARDQWNRSAAGWNDYSTQIGTWLGPATQAMLDMAGIEPGARVLDVAAGAGGQTLDLARRVGQGGHVLATDLSPAILALAQRNAEQAGHDNVQTQVADGEDLPVQSEHFDAAVCRLGLMLFPNPLQGLREIHRALRPGGRLCAVVFAGPERNPCVAILMATALKHAGLEPRDPFQPGGLLSLGKPGLADTLFRTAGFDEVATTSMSAPFRLPSARAYLEFVRASASPIQQILGRLDPSAADAAWAEMEERLGAFTTPSGWVGPNELLLTVGRR